MEELRKNSELIDKEEIVVLPDSLLYQFGNESNFKNQLRAEIEKNIKNGMIDKFDNEVILKNVIGPDYIAFSKVDKDNLDKKVEEILSQIRQDRLDKERENEYHKLSSGSLRGQMRDARRAGYSSVEELEKYMDNEVYEKN